MLAGCLLLASAVPPPQCEEVGFAALCERSACAKLAQYVHDKELVAMCNQCCSDRGGGTRYQAAALEMCD